MHACNYVCMYVCTGNVHMYVISTYIYIMYVDVCRNKFIYMYAYKLLTCKHACRPT